jgi:glyoxylase-like metal-dependent hydrolase (beta-lactamase superfamily II)
MPPRLDLIDLDQTQLEGYRRFISCWLSRDAGPTFVVDPGPPSTGPVLVERLREMGVDRLDLVLLTHIHLDHGGATAALLEAYPDARVHCHERGRKHLIAPQKLWDGSRAVLGTVAERYGEPRPVPAEALIDDAALADHGLVVVETPGHAAHHVSYLHAGTLFLGEAAGTFLDLGTPPWYLRPATPPRFYLETALASLERLRELQPGPDRLAFAHHGRLDGGADELLRLAAEQLQHWVATVREVRHEVPKADFETLAGLIVARLEATDPHFARRADLPADIAVRERDYTRQTLRGMLQYVEEGDGSPGPSRAER